MIQFLQIVGMGLIENKKWVWEDPMFLASETPCSSTPKRKDADLWGGLGIKQEPTTCTEGKGRLPTLLP